VGTLDYARTCYAHLAGRLGVQIADALQERVLLKSHDAKNYAITPSGREWFETLEIAVPSSNLTRRCLDWTERRHHVAGPLGCAIYKRSRELGWLVPVRDSRAVRVTLAGKQHLWELLRIPVA
jgi:hypothetical protein